MLQSGSTIQVNAEDVISDLGQSPRAGLTEATGRTQYEGPMARANVFRHSDWLRMNEKRGRHYPRVPANKKRYWRDL